VEHVDIITFYNEVFVPSVKPLLVELGSSCQKHNNKSVEERSTANGTLQIDITGLGILVGTQTLKRQHTNRIF
jgi:hypothetical protein